MSFQKHELVDILQVVCALRHVRACEDASDLCLTLIEMEPQINRAIEAVEREYTETYGA